MKQVGIVAVVLGAVAVATWWVRHELAVRAVATSGTVSARAETHSGPPRVVALGRIEPHDGVIRVAGPSRLQPAVVISRLLVDKGDRVAAGQPIAVLDSFESQQATVERLRAERDHAQSEAERYDTLYRTKVVSVSERDSWRTKAHMLSARLRQAEVELDQMTVRAPAAGQILDVHARAGERVGADGIVEMGKTDEMFAIAEVYETDIGRVRLGQRATVTSPALPAPLTGVVDRIGMKIGKADEIDVDPIAATDARVIEVEVRLDDSAAVANLTNLQVEVAIAADAGR